MKTQGSSQVPHKEDKENIRYDFNVGVMGAGAGKSAPPSTPSKPKLRPTPATSPVLRMGDGSPSSSMLQMMASPVVSSSAPSVDTAAVISPILPMAASFRSPDSVLLMVPSPTSPMLPMQDGATSAVVSDSVLEMAASPVPGVEHKNVSSGSVLSMVATPPASAVTPVGKPTRAWRRRQRKFERDMLYTPKSSSGASVPGSEPIDRKVARSVRDNIAAEERKQREDQQIKLIIKTTEERDEALALATEVVVSSTDLENQLSLEKKQVATLTQEVKRLHDQIDETKRANKTAVASLRKIIKKQETSLSQEEEAQDRLKKKQVEEVEKLEEEKRTLEQRLAKNDKLARQREAEAIATQTELYQKQLTDFRKSYAETISKLEAKTVHLEIQLKQARAKEVEYEKREQKLKEQAAWDAKSLENEKYVSKVGAQIATAEVAKLNEAHKKELAELERVNAEQVAALEKKLEEKVAAVSTERSRLEIYYQQQIAELAKANAAKIVELKEAQRKALAEREEAFAAERASAVDAERKHLGTEHEQQITALNQANATKIAELDETHRQALIALEEKKAAAISDERQRLETDYEQRIAELKRVNADQVAALEKKLEEKVAAVSTEQSRLEINYKQQIARLTESKTQDITALRDAHEKALTELQARLENDKADAVSAESERLEAKYQRQITQLNQVNGTKIAELKEIHRQALTAGGEEHKKALTEQEKLLKNQLAALERTKAADAKKAEEQKLEIEQQLTAVRAQNRTLETEAQRKETAHTEALAQQEKLLKDQIATLEAQLTTEDEKLNPGKAAPSSDRAALFAAPPSESKVTAEDLSDYGYATDLNKAKNEFAIVYGKLAKVLEEKKPANVAYRDLATQFSGMVHVSKDLNHVNYYTQVIVGMIEYIHDASMGWEKSKLKTLSSGSYYFKKEDEAANGKVPEFLPSPAGWTNKQSVAAAIAIASLLFVAYTAGCIWGPVYLGTIAEAAFNLQQQAELAVGAAIFLTSIGYSLFSSGPEPVRARVEASEFNKVIKPR